MKFKLKVLPLIVTLALVGCSQQSAEEYIAAAQIKFGQNQNSGAIIDLKNAIQTDPQNATARYLLGKAYVERGSAAAAEKELQQALKLGYEQNDVLPLLASAYSLQFKNQQIIDLVDKSKGLSPAAETSLLVYKAMAYFQLNKVGEAKEALNAANDLSADSVYGQLGSAYLSFSDKKIDDAISKIDQLLAEQPEFAEAILLKGQLATINRDNALAAESFEKYQKLLPDVIQARIFLANAYIKNKQFDKAETYIDQLLKINKDQPFINQLKGLIRYQKQDFAGAKLYTEVAIQNGLRSTPNLIIAGISSFQQKNYEQAYQHLSAVEGDLPPDHPIQKLLAMIELKLGHNIDAADKLTDMKSLTEDDIVILSAASAQLMREGKTEQAKALLEKSDTMTFSDPLRLAQKGMMRLSMDDLEGITDLEQALSLNPDLDTANTILARAYIDGGLYKEALELADKWIEKKPDEVNGYVLAAVAYLKLNDVAQTEKMYNKALQIDMGNPAANIYFADKAVEASQSQPALDNLQNILTSYPDYIPALRKYFVLQRENNNVEAGLKAIKNAFDKDQTNPALPILYAQALFTDKRYEKTIEVLESFKTENAKPDSYWVLLGNAYYFNNQLNKSLELAQAWVQEMPNNRSPYIRLISLYELNNDNTSALKIAKSAYQQFSADPQFGMLVTHFDIITGDIAGAEKSWNQLPHDIQENVVGQGLLGQILLEKGQPKKAAPLLYAFYQQKPNYINSTYFAKSLKIQGKFSESIDFLQQHQQKNQQNSKESLATSLQIAELAINANNYPLAIAEYENVIKLDVKNYRALNNLAYMLMEQKNYTKAVDYAKRAVEVMPENPSLIDTYALALLRVGKAQEAVNYFDQAYRFSPNSTDIVLHYAEALIAVDRKPTANTLLDSLKVQEPKIQAEIKRIKEMM